MKLTNEQKRDAIHHYCSHKHYCTTNQAYPCPLYSLYSAHHGCATCSNEYLDEHFRLVSAMPDYKGPKESPIEHDGCTECKHLVKDENEFPCISCKGSVPAGHPEYETRPDMFEPEEPEEPVATPTKPSGIYDNVNHPQHYTSGGIECIDEMEIVFGREAVKHFCLCNVWKYRKRALLKNGQEDLDKADWYMAKYKELEDKEYGCDIKLP